MKIRKIKLNRRKVESFLDSRLEQRLMDIQEQLKEGIDPRAYLDGPDPDCCRDIWDEVFKMTSKVAFSSAGHEHFPADTKVTVNLLTRDGYGKVEGPESFLGTTLRLSNSLYRIFWDSYELGDGAVRLLEPGGSDTLEIGLEEDELAGFLLEFDALVPLIRKKLDVWSRKVSDAARKAMESIRTERRIQKAVEGLLEEYVRPLGIEYECFIDKETVGLVLYGPQEDRLLKIPVKEFPDFVQDQAALSTALKGTRACR